MAITNTNEAECKTGYLEMIIGCMFSGKTTALIDKIQTMSCTGGSMLVVSHAIDTRYGQDSMIVSHDNVRLPAVFASNLLPILDSDAYKSASTVLVEEAHFFEDLEAFVKTAVEEHNKHVVVCGLDGTFKREPFMNIARLVPFADKVTKKTAKCAICGKTAPFSKRIKDLQDTILVGSSEAYQPRCREHFAK